MAKAILAAVLMVFGATAAGAQLRPSSTPEIVAAVKDCIGASSGGGVSEQALLGAGWSRATMSKDGKVIQANIGFYGKAKNNPVIITDARNGRAGSVCFVTARFRELGEYQKLLSAIDALDNVNAVKREGSSVAFSRGNQVIQASLAGSREQPGVRIAVAALAATAKN